MAQTTAAQASGRYYARPVPDVFDLVDRLWRGEVEIGEFHPVSGTMKAGGLAEAADGVAFVPSFANVSAFATGDGLVLVDTGSSFLARTVHEQLRGWSPAPLHTAVYSHGHIDHVFGVPVFEEEARANGWPMPRVLAHEALPARFDRYVLTAGYNSVINQRQFQAPGLRWPTEYRYPDETYRDRHDVAVGGTTFELHHAKGETDDHTWTWVPSRKVLCCGDLFIWASPNAGNPQKVQRYPREWAAALRTMAGLGAELLLPGHGFPIRGSDRIREALVDTAALLESLVDQALALMNDGARLDDVLHSVRAPDELLAKPYLRPVYDEPEFVVRNVWRLYGGWYDGNPASLKPAPEPLLAGELAALAGGADVLARRAREVAAAGDDTSLRLAGHLAELATQADPSSALAHEVRAEVFARRAEAATSTMAKGVFSWAAAESRGHAHECPESEER
jgi:alkyl sulfatase BDS1-like metallo-beta-lactamase superfamily hydrolase